MKQRLMAKLEKLSQDNSNAVLLKILKSSEQSKNLLLSLKTGECGRMVEWNDILTGLDDVMLNCALLITDGKIENDELKQLIGLT